MDKDSAEILAQAIKNEVENNPVIFGNSLEITVVETLGYGYKVQVY